MKGVSAMELNNKQRAHELAIAYVTELLKEGKIDENHMAFVNAYKEAYKKFFGPICTANL